MFSLYPIKKLEFIKILISREKNRTYKEMKSLCVFLYTLPT